MLNITSDGVAPSKDSPHKAVVVGAGVIGLSAALQLQMRGHAVTILARDLPQPFETIDNAAMINYASAWGGAHNRWVPPTSALEERDHSFSLQTFRHMENLRAARMCDEAGVTFLRGVEYLEAPPPQYQELTAERARELRMPGFKELAKDELPGGITWGCEYNTWCVNPMMYCAFLLRKFSWHGGTVIRKTLRDLREVFATQEFKDVGVVVNCSGYGFGDPKAYPIRGQTCLVREVCDATVTTQLASGAWSFSVPRGFHGGTVIGGTKEPGDWNPHPDPATRRRLLDDFKRLYPRILPEGRDELTVVRDIVGRRPAREGGIRLEREDVGDGKTVVHAYGLGGRGFELSWGVAEAVVALVTGDEVDLSDGMPMGT